MLNKLAAKILHTHSEEFAPGIPVEKQRHPIPTVKKPEVWELTAQLHEAERAGKHIDLRLIDPDGRAHSWAIPKARLPSPGETVLAIPQPTHTRDYAALKGTFEIREGYGKGRVYAPGLQPVEVVEAKPSKVRFNLYGSKGEVQEYLLIHTPKGGLLRNVTTTAAHGIPTSKPKYREIKEEHKLGYDDPNVVHQAKLDGAHVTYHLKAGKPLRIFSYRPAERETGVIEHTHKLLDWHERVVPKKLDDTIVRGELYATKDGRAVPAHILGGLLNATTWNSRQKQKETGIRLKTAIFDVVKFRGKRMEDAPYAEKLEVLRKVQEALPVLHLPPMAVAPEEKRKLFKQIESGKHPLTDEGIIEWHLDKPTPTKFKFRPDYDAEVVGVTKGKGRFADSIGALLVRLPGKKAITHVGTGLSDRLRRDIAKNPEEYIGRVAKIRAQQVFSSGRMRAPSFAGFHLEKGKQPMEKSAGSKIGRLLSPVEYAILRVVS